MSIQGRHMRQEDVPVSDFVEIYLYQLTQTLVNERFLLHHDK